VMSSTAVGKGWATGKSAPSGRREA